MKNYPQFQCVHRQFSIDGETYKIGDCVLISKSEVISATVDQDDCYIAQLVDLYEKGL